MAGQYRPTGPRIATGNSIGGAGNTARHVGLPFIARPTTGADLPPEDVVSNDVTGTGAVTAEQATVASSGALTISGSGAVSAAGATVSATGTEQFTGTGAVTARQATLSASATESIPGTGAVTAAAATATGSGGETFAGTGSPQAAGATLSATGTVSSPVDGDAAVTAAEAVVNGQGTGGPDFISHVAGGLRRQQPAPVLVPVAISGQGRVSARHPTMRAVGRVNDDELVLSLLVGVPA